MSLISGGSFSIGPREAVWTTLRAPDDILMEALQNFRLFAQFTLTDKVARIIHDITSDGTARFKSGFLIVHVTVPLKAGRGSFSLILHGWPYRTPDFDAPYLFLVGSMFYLPNTEFEQLDPFQHPMLDIIGLAG